MSLIPNGLEQTASEIYALYDEAELAIIGRLKTRLARGLDSPGWAEAKLAEVQHMKESAAQILDRLRSETDPTRADCLERALKTGQNAFAMDMRGLGLEVGLFDYKMGRLALLISDMQQRTATMHDTILRNTVDAYRRIIGESIQLSTIGVETTKQALRRSLAEFARQGISSFTDKAGRTWGMAEYSEMAVRTGMMRASIEGYAAQAAAYGEDLVIITDHSDECHLCRPWENRILSLNGTQRNDPECTGMLEDARAAGLFHPNCLHSFNVYVKGLSALSGGDKQTPVRNEQGYENRQHQRYMERTVRMWKRRQAAAIDPMDERIAKGHVDQWQTRLRAHASSADLPRKYDREGGRVLLSDKAKKMKPVKFDHKGKPVRKEKKHGRKVKDRNA